MQKTKALDNIFIDFLKINAFLVMGFYLRLVYLNTPKNFYTMNSAFIPSIKWDIMHVVYIRSCMQLKNKKIINEIFINFSIS